MMRSVMLYSPHLAPITFQRKKTYQVFSEIILNDFNFHLVAEEFVKHGTHKQLHCEGHPCAHCGKCRDWQFKGNLETWHWIQNYKSWNEDDKERWIRLYPPDFKKRSGATCFYQFSSPHYFHYLNFYSHDQLGGPLSHIPGPFFDPPPGCLCDNNHEN